jgi:hypothetical protein
MRTNASKVDVGFVKLYTTDSVVFSLFVGQTNFALPTNMFYATVSDIRSQISCFTQSQISCLVFLDESISTYLTLVYPCFSNLIIQCPDFLPNIKVPTKFPFRYTFAYSLLPPINDSKILSFWW